MAPSIPALLNSRSTPPKRSCVAAATRSQASACVTSPSATSAAPPARSTDAPASPSALPGKSTSTTLGAPSLRMVLLKGVDARGFVFFTNYDSRKGLELAANPRAALLLYWQRLSRQVRIEGAIERVSRAESEAYYRTRPRDARLGAWASRQSAVIPSRDGLDRRLAELAEQYPDDNVPLPPYWGGFR